MTDYPELEAAKPRWRFEPEADCLRDKAILVTGAGDGIGRTAAKTFAHYGANVILLGRTRSKLEAVFDWITAHTETEPVIVPCDLAHLGDENADSLATAVEDAFGRLDGLLHNASLLGPKVPLDHYPTPDWEAVLRVNATSVFVLTRALLPLLVRAPAASVVMTSSSVGRKARAFWGAYAVSKFAAEGLMQVLADEHEHLGTLRINSLNPGATRTAMRRAAYPAENPAEVPTAEERMDVYLYLFSDRSRGVNGAQLDARDWPGP